MNVIGTVAIVLASALVAFTLAIHGAKLTLLRIRIERLENERKDIDAAIAAATATIAENWDRDVSAGYCADDTDDRDSERSGSAGDVQADRAGNDDASAGDAGRRLSVTIGYSTKAYTFYDLMQWEWCEYGPTTCDHIAHVRIGRRNTIWEYGK